MTMTIGRAAVNEDPYDLQVSGNSVSFSFMLGATDANNGLALIQQLSGLLDNPDEPTIPFTWTEDPSFDGFYMIESLNITPVMVYLSTGEAVCSVSMSKVRGFSRPQFETVVTTAVLTNGHGVTAPLGIGYGGYQPSGYFESDATQSIATISTGTLATEDGTVAFGRSVAPLTTTPWQMFTSPADYYKGQAKIEVKYGSIWYPIHGRQIPRGVGLNWRISNGYCRAYPTQNGTAFHLTVETYRSGSWFGSEFGAAIYSAGVFSSFVSIAGTTGVAAADPFVVVNTPERVSIATSSALSAPTSGVSNVFSLRATDTWVELSIANSTGIGIVRTTNEAGTGFAGGVAATANNANGLRYLIATPTTSTTDTTKGGITSGATGTRALYQVSADYQVGVQTTTTTVRDLFYATRSERRRVVPR